MIPKKIHFVWFGRNPLDELTLKCIESWKKYCPDYEIKKWDENSFDFSINLYAKEAYSAKKWAFVSDYARLKILYDEGGIYLDSDMEILKNLDIFLKNELFAGFEGDKFINAAILGSVKSHPILKQMLKSYENDKFILDSNLYNERTIVERFSKILKSNSFKLNNKTQIINKVAIYKSDFFYPKNLEKNTIYITENSASIHHFSSSWYSKFSTKKSKSLAKLKAVFGNKLGLLLYRFYSIYLYIKEYGFKKFLALLVKKIKDRI
ncbi:glycosyl transferase [Campylobacter ureolyticus]|uniref:Glycosyl transferase n=1 Tax=Campylobacter ureolyticus TaxID=827 RepID=A0A2I1NAQ8_9BACT|nr:glycosyltransferase [Campylobacter ureolyticus]MCR8699418.1 glycosyl transferase [Campylobacter ureolyticus]PKZ29467.1 glycosyl transferase [Campylobacter ureolyticus]